MKPTTNNNQKVEHITFLDGNSVITLNYNLQENTIVWHIQMIKVLSSRDQIFIL